MNKAIGIWGGTFDPIHLGHLRTALEVAQQLRLAKVHIIPTFTPPHRDQPVASPHQRLEMARIATANEPLFFVDEREMTRKGVSYSIDSLIELRNELGATPLCFMIGTDAFYSLPTWHRYTELLTYAHLIVISRPGFEAPTQGEMADLFAKRQHSIDFLHQQSAGGIFAVTTTSLAISASNIRKEIAMGMNPRYLLPDDVYNYIQHNGIYQQ